MFEMGLIGTLPRPPRCKKHWQVDYFLRLGKTLCYRDYYGRDISLLVWHHQRHARVTLYSLHPALIQINKLESSITCTLCTELFLMYIIYYIPLYWCWWNNFEPRNWQDEDYIFSFFIDKSNWLSNVLTRQCTFASPSHNYTIYKVVIRLECRHVKH